MHPLQNFRTSLFAADATHQKKVFMSWCHSIRLKTHIFPTPQKSYATIFLGCTGPFYGPNNTNHTKNYQKVTFGALFGPPPQNCTTVHHSAVQCIVV